MNKKITSALILLISVSFGYIVGIGTFPCYSTEELTKDIAMTSSEYSRIVWYRDTIVYETVRKRYLSVPNYHSLSAVSMYMANVYDYIPANYDFYKELKDTFDENNIEMDEETNKLIMFYLRRGAQKGDQRAIRELKKYKDI